MRKFTLIPQEEISIFSTNVTDTHPVYDANIGYEDGTRVQHNNAIYEVYNVLLSTRSTYPKCPLGSPADITYTDIGIVSWDGISATSTKSCSNPLDPFNPIVTNYTFTNIVNTSGVITANMSIDGAAAIAITVYDSYTAATVGDYFLEGGDLYEKTAVVNSWGHDLKYYEALNQNKVIDDDGGTRTLSTLPYIDYTFTMSQCKGIIITGINAESVEVSTGNISPTPDENFTRYTRRNTPAILIEFNYATPGMYIRFNKIVGDSYLGVGNVYFIKDTLDIGITSYTISSSIVNYGKTIEKLGGKYEYIHGVSLDKYNIEVRQNLEKMQDIKEDIKAFGKEKSGWEISPKTEDDLHIVTVGRLGELSLNTIVKDNRLDDIFSMQFTIEETS